MDILGTGLSGLVGSRITQILSDEYSFIDLSKETGYDILDFPSVRRVFSETNAPVVFHFAAYTDVAKAQEEKDQGKDSLSWQVNVSATKHIVELCQETGKKLVYLSTDYIFDGRKDSYCESDEGNPISWYGRTKYEGELLVRSLGSKALTLRISTPYRARPVGKIDFVHKILEKVRNGETIHAPTDQYFTPTFIDDLAFSLKTLLTHVSSGIYNIGARECVTAYEAAFNIAQCYGVAGSHIQKTTYEAYFRGKAKPPRHACLKHDKIDALGVDLCSFLEGIRKVQKEEGISL